MLALNFAHTLGPVLIGLALALFPTLVLDGRGQVRPALVALLWAAALAVVATNASTIAVNDDEVFYLADSWAAGQGETGGWLPMRYLLFRPFLWLGVGPGATIVAGRVAIALACLVAGALAARLARRATATPALAWAAGALAILWLATTAQMAILRPEYLAATLLLVGVALLATPPTRPDRRFTVVAAFFLLTLAGTTSHRQAPFVPFALAVVWASTAPAERRRDLAAAAVGIVFGVVPSVAYVLAHDSLRALVYWNWTFVLRHSGVQPDLAEGRFPVFLFVAALAGAGQAWPRREDRAGLVLAAFWAAATLLATLMPFSGPYALGPWLALSAALAAVVIGRTLAERGDAGRRLAAGLLAVLAAGPLLDPAGLRPPPGRQVIVSQLRLLDWLQEVGGDGPVALVAPYHPIRAHNAWRLWNAWWYSHMRDKDFNHDLNPELVDRLGSGRIRVIAWDPWPEAGYRNVLSYLTANRFATQEEARDLALRLGQAYRLVRWNGPLPEGFGGGRFLVRRDIAVDDRVSELNPDRLLPENAEPPRRP